MEPECFSQSVDIIVGSTESIDGSRSATKVGDIVKQCFQ